MSNWFVYILECGDSSLYAGITTDIKKRFNVHASGKGSKYIRSRGAKSIVFELEVKNRSIASKIECKIKKLSRKHKLKLVELWGIK